MNGALCQSCNKSKANLHAHKSTLDPGTVFLMCQTCIDSKFEPRWFVILWGRTNGFESVSKLISPKQRYYGSPIAASDLIR